MTIRRNNVRSQHRYYESNHEQAEKKEDQRLHWIYEQYHSGKTLTIDDFKYLAKMDPEGCKKLMHSMLEKEQDVHKDDTRLQKEQVAIECIKRIENDLRIAKERLDIKNAPHEFETNETFVSVQESLENVKKMVLIMNEADLADMMDHLYEITELRTQYEDEVIGWEMLLEETNRYYEPFIESKRSFFV